MEFAIPLMMATVGAALLLLCVLTARSRRTRPAGSVRMAAVPAVVVEFGYGLLACFIPVFRRLHITPNGLSSASLPVAVFAALAIGHGWFAVGGALLLLAFSFDAWDGLLARATSTACEAGEVLDATVDRYTDVIVMLGFLYYYRMDTLPWLLAGAALVGTVLVSYSRAKGEAFGIVADFGMMQRHERAVWLGLATLVAPAIAALVGDAAIRPRYHAVMIALAVVAIGTNVTAVRRARFVITRLMNSASSVGVSEDADECSLAGDEHASHHDGQLRADLKPLLHRAIAMQSNGAGRLVLRVFEGCPACGDQHIVVRVRQRGAA